MTSEATESTETTRRIAYVSTFLRKPGYSNFANELQDIVKESRENNKQKEITSVLFVAHGNCFQVLEGESSSVQQLVYKIFRDKRHHNAELVLNRSIENRLFGEWSMRLAMAGTSTFKLLIERLEATEGTALMNQEERLSNFFLPCKNQQEDPTSATLFSNSLLSMTTWPNPTQIQFTPEIMRICSYLVGKQATSKELINTGVFNNESELFTQLKRLHELRVLTVRDQAPNEVRFLSAQEFTDSPKPNQRSFSHILRSFLKTRTNASN